MLTPELIRRFDVKPGMKVECRWSGAPHYFPAQSPRWKASASTSSTKTATTNDQHPPVPHPAEEPV